MDVIRKYSDRLHYWESVKDRGHAHAINKGFSHTTGEIMAWLNSDDKYTPWAFQAVSEIFEQFPDVMWITGISSNWNNRGAMTNVGKNCKNIYDFLLGNYAWIQQESTFWRRSLWDKVGSALNESYAFMVDGELWTRFFLWAELWTVDCVFAGYRIHSNNRALSNMAKCHEEMIRAISSMKKCVDPIILKDAKNLELTRVFRSSRLFDCAKLNYVIRKILFRQTLRCARYPRIAFGNQEWEQSFSEFFGY